MPQISSSSSSESDDHAYKKKVYYKRSSSSKEPTPQQQHILVFGGKTYSDILDGNFHFDRTVKSVVLAHAVRHVYFKAAPPTVKDFVQLVCHPIVSVPRTLGPEVLSSCLVGLTTLIQSTIQKAMSATLIVEHQSQESAREGVKVSDALYDAAIAKDPKLWDEVTTRNSKLLRTHAQTRTYRVATISTKERPSSYSALVRETISYFTATGNVATPKINKAMTITPQVGPSSTSRKPKYSAVAEPITKADMQRYKGQKMAYETLTTALFRLLESSEADSKAVENLIAAMGGEQAAADFSAKLDYQTLVMTAAKAHLLVPADYGSVPSEDEDDDEEEEDNDDSEESSAYSGTG